MLSKRLLLTLGILSCGLALAAPQGNPSVPGDFPISVWEQKKRVSQLPVDFRISKPSVRSDLRLEFLISFFSRVRPREQDHSRTIGLFVRALQNNQEIARRFVENVRIDFASGWSRGGQIVGIAGPGKYTLQLATLDRTTGEYTTHYEDVSIPGNPTAPLERALAGSTNFELVPVKERAPRELRIPSAEVLLSGIGRGTGILVKLAILTGSENGDSPTRPRLVVERSVPLHVSVITTLDAPTVKPGFQPDPFEANLSSLLAVFSRLEPSRGSARLTGLDLTAGSRVIDELELKGVTSEVVHSALSRDLTSISLDRLAGNPDRGRVLKEVLDEKLSLAENDTSGAEHAIVVVSAFSQFSRKPQLAPRRSECHCKVFYFRFATAPNEADDIDDLLKPLRPRVYTPLSWSEFREDFGAMFAQLTR